MKRIITLKQLEDAVKKQEKKEEQSKRAKLIILGRENKKMKMYLKIICVYNNKEQCPLLNK